MTWDYHAPWWLPGGDAQTVIAASLAHLTHRPVPSWTRTRWDTPDGDFVDVDWQSAHQAHKKSAPLLVLFHGLEGSSASHYALAFAAQVRSLGWHMAVPHFRGCSGEINRAPRAYHSGDYEEIDWMLHRFRQCHSGPIYALGISLGGNALLCWAAQLGTAASRLVTAVASVCAPLDLTASGHHIDRGLNRWIYVRMFLNTMKPRALQKLQQFPKLFDPQALLAARTLYEFDNVFTAPVHGFKDTDDYWLRASAKPGLSQVRLPALIVNARNDPFMPPSSLPSKEQVSDSVTLWQPAQGGHVGFVSGHFPGDLSALPKAVLKWMSHG